MADLKELNQMVTRFFALELPIAKPEDVLKTSVNRVGSKVSLGDSTGKGAEGLDALMVVAKQPTGTYQLISFSDWMQQKDMKNKDDQTMAKEVSKLLKNGQMVFSQHGCEYPSRLEFREDGKSLQGKGLRPIEDMERPKLGWFRTLLRAVGLLDPKTEKEHEQAKAEYAMYQYGKKQAKQVSDAVEDSNGTLRSTGGILDRGRYIATNEADKEEMPLIVDGILERNGKEILDKDYNVDPVATTNWRIAAENAALEEQKKPLSPDVVARRAVKLQAWNEAPSMSATEFQTQVKEMQKVKENIDARKARTDPRMQARREKLESIRDLGILKVVLQAGSDMKKEEFDVLVASVLLQGMGERDPQLDSKTNTKELKKDFREKCEVLSQTKAFQDTVYNEEEPMEALVGRNKLFDAFTKNVISNQKNDESIRTFTDAEMQNSLSLCRDPDGMKKHMEKTLAAQQKTGDDKPLTQSQEKQTAQKEAPKAMSSGPER